MCAPDGTQRNVLAIMSRAIIVLSIGLGFQAARANDTITVNSGDLCIVLGPQAASAERRAAEFFVDEVKRRTGLDVPIGSDVTTKYALVIGMVHSNAAIQSDDQVRAAAGALKEDGFHLMAVPTGDGSMHNGRMYVVGQSPSGVVAGMGKLLRLSRYVDGAIEIPSVTMTSHPKMPMRGMYFCSHYNNFYHVAPWDEVDPVIEDCALWGLNYLTVWFDMHDYAGMTDPAAQKQLVRLRHFLETARNIGMKVGLEFLANEAYANSPEHLRAKWRPHWPHYHVELCPSIPEGLGLIGKWQAEVLDAFGRLDCADAWPYDQGGCACDRCAPWGCNGYLRSAEQLARLFHERNPKGKFLLSTWLFDSLDEKGKIGWDGLTHEGEYAGLFRYIREKKPDWFQGILVGTHGDWIPKPLLDRPFPKKYPLVSFPEISMYKMVPWGGYGANPLPDLCARLASRFRDHIIGGFPYSEGIYEDLNKFFWAQFFWDPYRPVDDILSEYAGYYFGPASVRDAVTLFHLLEKTHPRRKGWKIDNLVEADEAWALAEVIDKRLPAWAKRSWRWRIIYIRAAIDHVLKTHGPYTAQARSALVPLCDELVRIYHAERSFVSPPIPGNRAFRCPVQVSSTHPIHEDSAPTLVDSVNSEDHSVNFWAHDPAKEKTAWLLLDFGEVFPMAEARLQFRSVNSMYRFVPQSVGFEVSIDGKAFEPAGESKDVPAEGSQYARRFKVYQIDKKGRYLRINLGPSQYVTPGDPYSGTIQLTEIQVFGE